MKINELLSDEFRIDTPYLPGEKGCRFTWILSEDEEKTLYVRHEDLMELDELLSHGSCLLYTSPSPRDHRGSRMPAAAVKKK